MKKATRERLDWCKGYRLWTKRARLTLAREIRNRRFLGIQRAA